MPISVNLAVTTWFPLEFNIHAWKLLPSAIIFIVIAFNKNHTGNNTLIMNHNSRNYSATIQGMRHSHSQVGKHVNGHTSASHISLNSILHRGRASDVMDQLMEATRTPENPDHQILTFCTWANVPSAQNPLLLVENISCPEFHHDPCKNSVHHDLQGCSTTFPELRQLSCSTQ